MCFVLTLRSMDVSDLALVGSWLQQPHVARWFLVGTSAQVELGELRRAITGEEATHALIASYNGAAIGWCQWYLCGDYPEHAVEVGAESGDVGIDYAIGVETRIGAGIGTALIAALVAHVRGHHPEAGLIADPEASNVASRRVLEKNGFLLMCERSLSSEPTNAPMAIYRLPPHT
jgi:aminoglycoside 6'-N-acetyltransferase